MNTDKIFINGATFGKFVTKTSQEQGGFGYGGSVKASIGKHDKTNKKTYVPQFNSLAEHMAAELNKTYQKED